MHAVEHKNMLYSVKQIAEKHGFSESQIRRLIRQDKIKARKVGNYYAIDERSVKDLKRTRSPKGSRKKNAKT